MPATATHKWIKASGRAIPKINPRNVANKTVGQCFGRVATGVLCIGVRVNVRSREVALPAIQQPHDPEPHKNHGQSNQCEFARVTERVGPLDASGARVIDNRGLQQKKEQRRRRYEKKCQQHLPDCCFARKRFLVQDPQSSIAGV